MAVQRKCETDVCVHLLQRNISILFSFGKLGLLLSLDDLGRWLHLYLRKPRHNAACGNHLPTRIVPFPHSVVLSCFALKPVRPLLLCVTKIPCEKIQLRTNPLRTLFIFTHTNTCMSLHKGSVCQSNDIDPHRYPCVEYHYLQ